MTPIVVLSLFIPLIGTTLGSAMVFFLKKEINPLLRKILMGFASGVMIAAAIWSLMIPAINSYNDFQKWLVPAASFLVGIGFMLLLDYLIPHMHLVKKQDEGIEAKKMSKTSKMLFAVTLHNIPEGLAVGVVISGMMTGHIQEWPMLTLAIGIAIQNFPEGIIVSGPLKEEGMPKWKAFLLGTLSGVVEPIASLIAIACTVFIEVILPYTLAFAAGVMIYVVVEELIPEANEGKHSNLATIGLAVGFALMMILDIALG